MLYSETRHLILIFLLFFSAHLSAAQNSELRVINRRTLLSIKETPIGGNSTFDCSPSGPCIPCSRSEKGDKKYRCGETGYRIRLKCVPSDDAKSLKEQKGRRSVLESENLRVDQHNADLTISSTNQRRLNAESSKSKGGPRPYITYRSCIPAVNEEKLSVLGFEALMGALLLSSGSFIYFRRKRANAAAGGAPVRLPTSSRF